MFLNGYPYTDFHEMNLDFLLRSMEELKKAFASFTASNSLIFAEPLLHDLTSTYAKNTIVLDPDGNAYISLQAVPAGVQLSNADYWLMVFNFEEYTEKANKNFTVNYLRDTTRAPQTYAVGDWIVLDDILYKATAAIAADDLLEVGVNLVHFTIEQFLNDFTASIIQTVNQYKNDIDYSEAQYRLQLAGDIATAVSGLQAQLDAAIAGATVDSEVINARVGDDGITYPTLGDAIRSQFHHVKFNASLIWNMVLNLMKPSYERYITEWDQGYRHGDGTLHTDSVYLCSKYPMFFRKGEVIVADPNVNFFYLVNEDGSWYRSAFSTNYTFSEDKWVYLQVKDNNGISVLDPYSVTVNSFSIIKPVLEVAALASDALYTKDNSAMSNVDFTLTGLLDSSGNFTADSDPDHKCTDFILLEQNVRYKLELTVNGSPAYPRYAMIYHADKSHSRTVAYNNSNDIFYLYGDEKFIRVNINTSAAFSISLIPTYEDATQTAIDNDVFIPSKSVTPFTIIHKRRPVVSFTLDGDYDMNSNFFDLFDSYGLKIACCLGYRSTDLYNVNSPDWYLEKQANGHEIMGYGTYPLPEGATYTTDQAEEFIRQSYQVLTSYGFNVHGFIGSMGEVADRYMPSIYKYYDFAATTDNHRDTDEPCLFFADDPPYRGWRYSMQASTLAQMKDAVDRAISENGNLQFYTHAESDNLQNSTIENVTELIEYILAKGTAIQIMTPTQAYFDYYAIRYEDI